MFHSIILFIRLFNSLKKTVCKMRLFWRAAFYIFGVKLFHGIGRFLFIFSATWICIGPALQNILHNIGHHRDFLICVTKENGSLSTDFDSVVATVHFVGAVFHWCALFALALVYLGCLWEVIVYSRKIRSEGSNYDSSSSTWSKILSAACTILMASGGTAATATYLFDFLFFSMWSTSNEGPHCVFSTLDYM